jgi:hypothetical protein
MGSTQTGTKLVHASRSKQFQGVRISTGKQQGVAASRRRTCKGHGQAAEVHQSPLLRWKCDGVCNNVLHFRAHLERRPISQKSLALRLGIRI